MKAMKKIQLILLALPLLFVCVLSASAQRGVPEFTGNHKNIYVEFNGSHLGTGVNFDMRFLPGRMDGLGFRAGIGATSGKAKFDGVRLNREVISLPVEINHLIGKKRTSLVTGIGILPVYNLKGAGDEVNVASILPAESGFGLAGGFMNLGIRHQPKKNGLMFQVNWNPMVTGTGDLNMGRFSFGIGIGFK